MANKRQKTKDLLNSSPALDAQFGGTPVAEAAPAEESQPTKREKDRITLRLYTDTLALLDALKIDARKQNRSATYGDVVEEAILDLARKYDLRV